MSKRKIHDYTEGAFTAKVYWDSELEEYSVKFYKDGKWMGEGPTYYTQDKQDAITTAEMEVQLLKAGQYNTQLYRMLNTEA